MLLGHYQSDLTEAGCDEAGRGCLAGPVFAAAVIFPAGYAHPKLNDSKKLSQKQRLYLRNEIESSAVAWAVEQSDNQYIDSHNILKASIHTMHKAIRKLPVTPGMLLIDGNYFIPLDQINYKCIVGGDGLYLSIAAASVLAKTYRDEYMASLHEQFPMYNWKKNKGYPTRDHRQALKKYGACKYHRRSFNLGINQLELEF